MKILIYMAVSVDGFISNKRGIPDWLSTEYGKGFFEICQKTNAVIMGRKTFDILGVDNLPLESDGTTIVLTSDPGRMSVNPTVFFTDKTPAEITAFLDEKNYTEAVIVGGAAAATGFIEAGLVDEIQLVTEPVIFGSGLPLINNPGIELKLSLEGIEKLNQNTIKTIYKISSSNEENRT